MTQLMSLCPCVLEPRLSRTERQTQGNTLTPLPCLLFPSVTQTQGFLFPSEPISHSLKDLHRCGHTLAWLALRWMYFSPAFSTSGKKSFISIKTTSDMCQEPTVPYMGMAECPAQGEDRDFASRNSVILQAEWTRKPNQDIIPAHPDHCSDPPRPVATLLSALLSWPGRSHCAHRTLGSGWTAEGLLWWELTAAGPLLTEARRNGEQIPQ